MAPDPLPDLIDALWLERNLSQVRVVDCRWYLDGRSGLDAYLAGHIPGSCWLDIDRDLAAPPTDHGGRHPLPPPDHFAAALGRQGIAPSTPVVAYDDAHGSIAARLWWMLRALGQPAGVLDGGISAWTGPLEVGPAGNVDPVDCPPRPWPHEMFVDTATVERLRLRPEVVVVDARVASRYAGADGSIDRRPGHIPGAVNAPWPDGVDPTTGRLHPPTVQSERFGQLGVHSAARVIASCGSGVTACHDLLAMRIAGVVAPLSLYTGSWSAWSADLDRPVARGHD